MVFLDDRNWKNEFTESFNEVFNVLMKVKGITVGTQTKRNLAELNVMQVTNSQYLPILMTEKTLLEPNLEKREGILWIGRWEPRKNPEEFIRVIKETGLPAKVITNSNGAKKFEQALKDIDATYEIKIGVYGKEKADFIKSARVAYNPAIRESFGLAFYECIGHMPTVALEGMSWLNNFRKQDYFAFPKSAIVEKIKALYNDYEDPNKWYEKDTLKHINNINNDGIKEWIKCFDSFEPVKSNSDRATINSYDEVKYIDYIQSLNRDSLCVEDIKSVLTNKHKYNIIYTDSNTYLSKDPNFVPVEKQSGLEGLFS
jgi:hypothetical protein